MNLITTRTRRAFRETLVGEYLAAIEELFEDEGFRPGPPPGDSVSGQRRRLVESYYAAVDWNSPEDTARMLRVMETAIHRMMTEGRDSEAEHIESLLKLDGFVRDERGALQPQTLVALPEGVLANLPDVSSIRYHLDRLAATTQADPEAAIGAAKELIESTAKLTLDALGQPWSDTSDLPELVRQAQKALALHPEVIAPDVKGATYIKGILGGLTAVAVGVAQLRNLYGTGHGKRSRHTGIRPRHAHLAVGAATVYCRMMLETLDDPDAPWHRKV